MKHLFLTPTSWLVKLYFICPALNLVVDQIPSDPPPSDSAVASFYQAVISAMYWLSVSTAV